MRYFTKWAVLSICAYVDVIAEDTVYCQPAWIALEGMILLVSEGVEEPLLGPGALSLLSTQCTGCVKKKIRLWAIA